MRLQGHSVRIGRLREEAYFAEQDQILLENLREVLALQAEAEAAGRQTCETTCESSAEASCTHRQLQTI